MERIRRRGLEVAVGLAMIAAMVTVVTLILVSFSGGFSDKITVTADLAQAGDALGPGDIVSYQDVIVGEVTDSTGRPDGSAVVGLKIDPAMATQIPASVQAVAVPASLFGNTKIQLLPNAGTAGPRLRDGDVVQADRSPAAESLQTALANAYDLLTAIHPAQLDAALAALATALDGKGAQLNTLVHTSAAYLQQLAPHLPALQRTISSLATVTEHLATNAPSLLGSLRDTLVIAKGIVDNRDAVTALLLVAPTALDHANALLSTRTVDNIVTVIRNEEPVTAAIGARPVALADLVHGFKTFADAFNSVLGSGPYLRANLVFTGADFTDLVPVAAGQQGRAFQSIVDPPLYATAQCPRYPGAAGPNCGATRTTSSAGAQLITSGSNYSGDSAVGSPEELTTVTAAAQSITGLSGGQLSPITADLLLGPLLRGTATAVNP